MTPPIAGATAHGMTIARSLVGNYTTSLEMAGCSITLTQLDDEMLRLWDSPIHTGRDCAGAVDG